MRRNPVILICHLAVAAISALAAPVGTLAPEAFDATILRGREALQAGLLSDAAAAFTQACPAEALALYARSRAGSCYHHLGVIAMKGSSPESALPLFEKAAEAWASLGVEYRDSWGYTQLILADLYQKQHQTARVETALKNYLGLMKNAPPSEDNKTPEALSRLALAYADMGRQALAKSTVLEALAAFEALPVARPAEAAYARNTLGVISLSAGHQQEAETNLLTAVQLAAAALGADHPETAGYQTNLALALLARGDAAGAIPLLRRARFVVERQPGISGNQEAMIAAELSAAAVIQNKLALAAEEAHKALDILARQQWPDPRAVALAQVNLADVHLHANRLSEAEPLLERAVATERRTVPGSRLLADGIRRLAQLRVRQQRFREASELYRETLALYDSVVGAGNPTLVPLLREYAESLKREGSSKAQIKDVETRAKMILGFRSGNR